MGALPQFPLPMTSLPRPSTRSPIEMFSVEKYLNRTENKELKRTAMNIIEEGKGCKEQTIAHLNEPRRCRHRLKLTSS